MQIEDDLQAVKRVFIDYPKQLKNAREELSRVQSEELDLLHVLELGKLNASEIMKVASELVKLLRKRRDLKDEIEKLSSITQLAKKAKEHEITNAIGDIRKIENIHGKRRYTMRVRSDLQPLVEVD